MKIVTLSTYDILGGAARSAWRLHTGLRSMGMDARMLVRVKASADGEVYAIPTPKPTGEGQMQRWDNLAAWLINNNRTDRSGIFFTLPVPGYDVASHPLVQEADIIHLHWVYSLLSPAGIQRLLNLGKPVVWTLHDQRPFTGGCHFSLGCRRYEQDCGLCPELRDNNADLARWLLADARRELDPSAIVVVSPSRWLAGCARQSSFFRRNRVEVIPYGLETDVFKPLDRKESRSELALPEDCLVLVFGADNASERRKGFFVLDQAFRRCQSQPEFASALADGRIRLLSFGKGSETAATEGLPVRSFGQLNDDQKLARIFSASDLLVCPTLDDNLPNVIMEARACGTAVLASRVGGVPELVAPGENGELFEPGDIQGLARMLLETWRDRAKLRKWSARSRELAGQGFGLEVQARRYHELYTELLAVPRSRMKLLAAKDSLPLLPDAWPAHYHVSGPGAPARDGAGPDSTQREADWYYIPGQGNGWRLTYSNPDPFLNREHERIWHAVGSHDGWPDETECRKLYELGYHNGRVILEFGSGGVGGALAALQGALTGRNEAPQYFAAVKDPAERLRRTKDLEKAGRGQQCILYCGSPAELLRDVPIVPGVVIINGPETEGGSGCYLQTLRWILAPGSMVLCRGYPDDERVRQAVDRVLRTAHLEFMGLFSRSVLLRATGACRGVVRGLPPESFDGLRDALAERYAEKAARKSCISVADIVAPVRDRLEPAVRTPAGCGPWPYAAPSMRPLPETLPGGQPWPRITVVTPSFNQGCYLEETILSVLNQDYPNLEYIVMDGGSTDESVSILERYSERLTYWASEKDRGQCDAINKGFARATGDILTWLNSDDMLAPGALAAVALARHTSGADMVAGICQVVQNGKLVNQHLTSCEDGPLPLGQLLDQENCWEKGHFFYQPEVFFTRDLWQRSGGKLDESLYFSLDYELWLRFAKAGARLKVVGVPLALYRMHEAQKTFYAEKFRPELRKVRDDFLGSRTEPKPPPGKAPKERLRIVLVNDMGFRFGAGIAHHRLGRALAAAGHELVALASAGVQIQEPAEAQKLGVQLLKRIRAEKPDLVFVGNTHASRFDGRVLEEIAQEWPMVLVSHDTWTFTGRCAYTGSCQKFLTGCDETCPTPDEYPQLAPAEIRPAWESKRRLLERAPGLVVATNSRWLCQKGSRMLDALRGEGREPKARVRTIRYGLPLDVFYPRDPDVCREILGLPRDKFLVFFCCTHVEDPRKGMSHLTEALLRLRLPDLVPVCLGAGATHLRTQLPDLVAIDYAMDPKRQAMLYSAADLFVGPSLEEAFGQVFIEAAACGTPSIAYAVDGVPEAVANGISGQLVASPHPAELAQAIAALYHNPRLRRDLGSWGTIWARSHFSFEASYHTLFGALREALAARDIQLSANLSFAPEPSPMPETQYLVPPPLEPTPFQRQIETYFQECLDKERARKWPWIFNPRAWIYRLNRSLLRRSGPGNPPSSS